MARSIGGTHCLSARSIRLVSRTSKIGNVKKGDMLVRWGFSGEPEVDASFKARGGIVLNQGNSISRNTNKLRTLELFKKSGLNTPTIFMDRNQINKFPVLGRDRHHAGGKDIVVINGDNRGSSFNNLSKIPKKDFYIEFIKARKEYRVHVFRGKVIRVQKKVFRGEDENGKKIERNEIKNSTYGWGMSLVDIDGFERAYIDASLKALDSIDLDFGAVDLLIGINDRPYPLEANSSPRLNDNGIELYAKEIVKAYNRKTTEYVVRKEKARTGYFWK